MTAPSSVIQRMNILRSTRSATAPDTSPRKKNGAIRAAEDTPTQKGELVSSNTTQPSATNSIPMPTDCTTVAVHRSLKSRR